jgi:transcriptional regulator with XRE-family HTH domain
MILKNEKHEHYGAKFKKGGPMNQRGLEKSVKKGNDNRASPTIAMWLSNRCKDEKLSYRKVAARTGLSHGTIAEIIGGARPSAATVVKLAAAFSPDGQHQRTALEDLLLRLCGYRSGEKEVELSEPLGRLMDKVSHFSEAQLHIVEQFAEFVAKVGDPLCTK